MQPFTEDAKCPKCGTAIPDGWERKEYFAAAGWVAYEGVGTRFRPHNGSWSSACGVCGGKGANGKKLGWRRYEAQVCSRCGGKGEVWHTYEPEKVERHCVCGYHWDEKPRDAEEE